MHYVFLIILAALALSCGDDQQEAPPPPQDHIITESLCRQFCYGGGIYDCFADPARYSHVEDLEMICEPYQAMTCELRAEDYERVEDGPEHFAAFEGARPCSQMCEQLGCHRFECASPWEELPATSNRCDPYYRLENGEFVEVREEEQ